MNKNKKQKKIIVAIILIISLIVGVTLYNNFTNNNKVVESSAVNELYTVILSEENCNIITDGNTSIIEKYICRVY